jgi:YetF C-terminal domain
MSWAFRFCLEVYFFLLPRAIGPPSELFDKANASRGLIGFDYSHACLEVWPCNGTFRHEYVLTIGSTLLGIGTEPKDLTFLQVSIRGVIVFIATLIMMRLGSKRSLAEKTAFDAVFVVIIGSILARAINGSEAFFPTLGAGFILVLLHRLFGIAAYYSHAFGILVKGKQVVLVQDGKLQRKNMLWEHITQHDLEEDMRLEAETDDLSKIQVARLERSGDISFIKAE